MKDGNFDPGLWQELPMLRILDLAAAADRLIDQEFRRLRVTLIEARVLAACAERPGITASQISIILPVDAPAISRLVNGLFQKGLLSRRRSRSDRRTVMLRPTDAGLALLQECLVLMGELEKEFLGPLSQRETNSLMCLVSKLLDAQS